LASFRPMLARGGPQAESRWSARSAVRTNDLEADEDSPHADGRVGGANTLWFKSSAASRGNGAGDTWGVPAQPYLGPRTLVRRHDDGWGARHAGLRRGAAAQSFREVHPTAGWRQEVRGSRPQASAVVWAGHARNASQAATSCAGVSGDAKAAS